MNGRMRNVVNTVSNTVSLTRKERALKLALMRLRIDFARNGIPKRIFSPNFSPLDMSLGERLPAVGECLHGKLEKTLLKCRRGDVADALYLVGVWDGMLIFGES